MPLGPMKRHERSDSNEELGFYSYMQYNEYIVREKTSAVIRYLVAFQ